MNTTNIIKYSSNLNIIYAENDESIREINIPLFKDFFNEIIIASDGEDALKKFKNNSIDLIIIDTNLPKLDGLNLIAKIRDIDASLPVIILSANNKPEIFIKSINLDVDGYLLKPLDINEFKKILEKLIQKLVIKNETEKKFNLFHQYQEVTDKNLTVSKADIHGKITYVNDKFCEISGHTRDYLIGKNHNVVRHPDMPTEIFKDMWDTIKKRKTTWYGTVRNLNKSGNSYYLKTTVKPILNKSDEIMEYISVRDDITDIMNPKKQLHDLVESCDETVIVLLKIEAFDDIEKFYGIKISEKIEDQFSKDILKHIPNELAFKKVFSLDDGEYALAKNKQHCNLEKENIIQVLKKFQNSINDFKLNICDINYDISVVVSFAYGVDALKNAKYGLKQICNNKQDFIVANNLVQKEYDEALKNLNTIKIIKKAIDNFKIISYFQPIINNKTKKIEKYESLVRLIDEDGKILSPFFFLETAKKGKYYSQITAMVLENSFAALKYTDMDISINISVLDIEKRLTREKIFELLSINKGKLHRVVFELLEDEDVKDFKLIKSFIQDVKNMGVKIAIDDFGAGYSNFERLLDYQPNILKIDGSLVKNIENDKFSLDVVETIVDFAKKQNIQTIAEFVENENIFNILNELGVDYSQGYYFGKPEALKY
ncbi:MAG: EAL domain-containing protein [Campylobacterota bacterium]|nr:EAL domain-containing protein [Campylobacterota bacterium]